MNFLLDLKRLIVSGDELCSNNKSNIGFLLKIYNLIIFKIVLYGRLLKICIGVNSDKPAPHQLFLILFLIIDFSCV